VLGNRLEKSCKWAFVRNRKTKRKQRDGKCGAGPPKTREQLRADYEALKLQFITTELELGLTFCEVAKTAGDEVRARRNLLHAREAYEIAKKLLAEARVSPALKQAAELKMGVLEIQLHSFEGPEPGAAFEGREAPNP
jgi:hypothetical protein